MADSTSTLAQEQMRQYLENWRRVNKAQDELVRSEPARDPAASFESGFSLIELARALRQASPQRGEADDADAESVRRTWCRLRAPYIR
jgi:hypothetical protein